MIGYIKGKVLNISADSAIIVTGGVGYEAYCSASAFSKMAVGQECEIYTYLQVSEVSGVQLYGFSSMQEKAMFLKLISVSGVGPKAGISVLSQMNVNDVAIAIATGDVKALSGVKGLGKKTAEKIIVELRDRVTAPAVANAKGGESDAFVSSSREDEDAVVALISLGFTRAESEKAVAKAKANGAGAIEEIIMLALKGM